MAVRREFPKLRQRLGDDGMLDLRGVLDDSGREWKDEVLRTAGDRFERRLSEELGKFRVEVTKEFADLRIEVASTRVSMLRWMFAMWASAILAMVLK